ncbi:AraC family transcriptional regulator [Niveispirillum lacus]|uniref:AraC family transcriptional regulator n=1 Tax=Niveispirillum lacus TaxID=1981099 RepID=A0A255YZU7_9PROT|nr:AraC family transcriptional regulator [Niveispirillum lacus]OYQ34767.1 AraC family transcriptional regulator [Niveispirillum lacus]
MPRRPADDHIFWRDPALPHLEAREVMDGRTVCYVPHSHATFSIGAITGGHSEYLTGTDRYQAFAGTVVLMNPEIVHSCNPVNDQPWSYRMLYVDTGWLATVQGQREFRPLAAVISRDAGLHADLMALFDLLFDMAVDAGEKDAGARAFFAGLAGRVEGAELPPAADHGALVRAADYITRYCTRDLRVEEVAAACGLSPSYLIRAFKARYGLTPHAYLTNQRVRAGQAGLRQGQPIAEVALDTGFADQAHFQRVFKAHVAATPGQYAVSTSPPKA